uniref:DNA-directed RNA polymerase subunit beta n=1 Tax=Haptophyceae sp. NIES-3900 TaxID=2748608 RepID=A0A7R6WDW6_9EUKA|nr:RNA polymerase subunit beta [Haptophyceae sp. NIES-3900]
MIQSNTVTPTFVLSELSEIQRASFCWFLKEALLEEFQNFSPIVDYTGARELHFFSKNFKLKAPKYNVSEARRCDATYSVQLYIPIELVDKDKAYIMEQEVFLGEIPLMTDRGTFIINGAERVIISQIVRSPGVYFNSEIDKYGVRTFVASIISDRGSWLRFETDKNSLVWVRIDKTRKIPAHIFLKALGLSDKQILDSLNHPEFFLKTFQLEGQFTKEESLIQIQNKLRPGEPATTSRGQHLIYSKFLDPKRYDLGNVGRYKINRKLNLSIPSHIRVLTSQDIISIVDYIINLEFNIGSTDDVDHLGNRRVRSVGELLQNQFRVGLTRLERIIRERLTVYDLDTRSVKPTALVNPKPLIASVREFFGSNPLSQFLDQTNPLAELTHKRRISSLGPGGISRERASFAIRDIHPSHYGRICPIETPEGPNAGLIGSLATQAKVNEYGFLETPFYKVKSGRVLFTRYPIFLTAEQEDEFRIAPGDVLFDNEGYIQKEEIAIRYRQEFHTTSRHNVDFIQVSPIQIISIATSLIPFLEHDDANRALMGSNMQRQAVPLLYPERPLVGTGLEAQAARDSGMVIVSRTSGKVLSVSSDKISLVDKEEKQIDYFLQKYHRSNQDTCINQRPIVWFGETVHAGQIIADGPATEGGELALGQNILIAYTPWEGYNYEDAFLISERLVYKDIYTSLHIEKHEVETRQTKLGPEEITREVPNLTEYTLRQLDDNGIIYTGSWVEVGDILVGKITPKVESDQPPEGKLLRAIFGEKSKDVRDNSLRVPNGGRGRVLDIRLFTKEQGHDLPPGTDSIVHIYIAQTRKIKVGDKMAGRHGNKGIISRILPIQDMPFLPDGTPIDIVLNPLGVPSRMNVGQLYECLLGLASVHLSTRFSVIPFDEKHGANASRILVNDALQQAKIKTKKTWLFDDKHPGKIPLYDGRTGEAFDNPVTIGVAYMLKLVHLVDNKIHARSTGPYSLVTQQPLGGKAQQGGQRLGEMEVWALEAFGAAYTLQELLTVKSDDMVGRNEVLNAIVKGKPIPRPGTPESFKVLMRELQSLALDIAAYKIQLTSNNVTQNVEVNLMSASYALLAPFRTT